MFEHVLARFGHVEADEDLGIPASGTRRPRLRGKTAYQHPPDIDAVAASALSGCREAESEWADAPARSGA